MAKEKLFHVGVKALITNQEGKILLFLADVSKHKTNIKPYWDIPGGRIQQGGAVLETLAREVQEETGVSKMQDATFLTAVVSKHEIPLNDGTLVGLVLMVYRVTIPVTSTIVLSEEHSRFEWVDGEEAKKRLADKYPLEFTDLLK